MRIYRHGVCEGFLDRIDRIAAQRRKTSLGSPKGERSESINKIELSLSPPGSEEFRPDQMLSNLCL
jgi:hypothetical protein